MRSGANVVLVEQDSYYRNLADMPLDERHQANFDHPDSIDSDMLVNHLIRLGIVGRDAAL